jgi:hypothetical protein
MGIVGFEAGRRGQPWERVPTHICLFAFTSVYMNLGGKSWSLSKMATKDWHPRIMAQIKRMLLTMTVFFKI